MKSIAYVAGIIDGEGTITLSHNNASDRYRHPVVSVASTTKEILDYLQEHYGGYIRNKKETRENCKQSYTWSVGHDKVFPILQDIIPYLLEPSKKYRANLILTTYKKVTKRNGKYSELDAKLKEEFEYNFFHPSTSSIVGSL